MKIYRKQSLVLGMVLGLIALPVLGFAEIRVNSDFEGSLVITSPDGSTQIYNPGDKLPVIPAGSKITVIGGTAEISTTEESEKVSGSCLNANADVSGGSSVKISCGDKTGNLEVLKGKAVVKLLSGEDKALQTGDRYPIVSEDSKLPADPTSAGESLGSTPPGDSEPNSRDMAVSPGQ